MNSFYIQSCKSIFFLKKGNHAPFYSDYHFLDVYLLVDLCDWEIHLILQKRAIPQMGLHTLYEFSTNSSIVI